VERHPGLNPAGRSGLYRNYNPQAACGSVSAATTVQLIHAQKGPDIVILISFDIDGTLEVGDPPGVLTMAMVKRVQKQGFLIGSCSDRPISAQRAIWAQHNISIDFAVGKLMLPDVKAQFVADVYYHIGDREDLDRRYALDAGFEFLWPHEAIVQPWFL
jgi:hypothetical protein